MKKLILIFSLIVAVTQLKAQNKMPATVAAALKADDAAALDKLVTKENVNDCYGNYGLLAEAIRNDAPKCFNLLIARGADVNKSCNGYVPPLMHAVKYGHLDMVKTLISKGANKDYKFEGTFKGENGPEKGDTPLSYAAKYEQDDIADYLNSLK